MLHPTPPPSSSGFRCPEGEAEWALSCWVECVIVYVSTHALRLDEGSPSFLGQRFCRGWSRTSGNLQWSTSLSPGSDARVSSIRPIARVQVRPAKTNISFVGRTLFVRYFVIFPNSPDTKWGIFPGSHS
jgi:hypothetical protein